MSRDSLLGERRTRDRKVASSNPGRSGGRIISPELTLCADSYSVSVTLRVTAVARKRPRSFCQKCRWHVIPYTRRSGLTMPLSRQSEGTYQETSSHATRQGTLSHSRLSSLSYCGTILRESICTPPPSQQKKKEKKAGTTTTTSSAVWNTKALVWKSSRHMTRLQRL